MKKINLTIKNNKIFLIVLSFIIGSLFASTFIFAYLNYFSRDNNFRTTNLANNFKLIKNDLIKEQKTNFSDEFLNENEISYYDENQDIIYEEINNNSIKKNFPNNKTKLRQIEINSNTQKENKQKNNNNLLANFLSFLSFLNNQQNDFNNLKSNNNQENNNSSSSNTNQQNNNTNSDYNQQNFNDQQDNNSNNDQSNNNQQNQNNDQNNSENEEIDDRPSRIKVLISEILIDGGRSNDEFIELYNPNNFEINLSGWKLIKFNKNNNQQTLIGLRTRNTFNNKIIRPYSYFLIANESGMYANNADLTYSESYNLAKDNAIILVNNNNEIVDLVGWGQAPRSENTAFNQNPSQNMSLVRKAGFDSNSQTMVSSEINFGNSLDTDNNNFDFVLLNPEPQNSHNQSEIPPQGITLINFEENENILIFKIISPYQGSNESRYVLLSFNIDDNIDNVDNYIRNNWQNFIMENYNLAPVEIGGKKQTIQINLGNETNNENGDNNTNERVYLLGLVINNQLINWVPDLND